MGPSVAHSISAEVLSDLGDVSEVQIKSCNGVRLAISQSFYCFRKRSFGCSGRGFAPRLEADGLSPRDLVEHLA